MSTKKHVSKRPSAEVKLNGIEKLGKVTHLGDVGILFLICLLLMLISAAMYLVNIEVFIFFCILTLLVIGFSCGYAYMSKYVHLLRNAGELANDIMDTVEDVHTDVNDYQNYATPVIDKLKKSFDAGEEIRNKLMKDVNSTEDNSDNYDIDVSDEIDQIYNQENENIVENEQKIEYSKETKPVDNSKEEENKIKSEEINEKSQITWDAKQDMTFNNDKPVEEPKSDDLNSTFNQQLNNDKKFGVSKIKNIRSGGQSGVDRAALDLARQYNIDIVGWCPKGGWAEDLPVAPGIRAYFPELKETPLDNVKQRTEWNVHDADATLICCKKHSPITGGTLFTVECCEQYNKPYLIVDGFDREKINNWLNTLPNNLDLNIAGPRESENKDIYFNAVDIIENILIMLGYEDNKVSNKELKDDNNLTNINSKEDNNTASGKQDNDSVMYESVNFVNENEQKNTINDNKNLDVIENIENKDSFENDISENQLKLDIPEIQQESFNTQPSDKEILGNGNVFEEEKLSLSNFNKPDDIQRDNQVADTSLFDRYKQRLNMQDSDEITEANKQKHEIEINIGDNNLNSEDKSQYDLEKKKLEESFVNKIQAYKEMKYGDSNTENESAEKDLHQVIEEMEKERSQHDHKPANEVMQNLTNKHIHDFLPHYVTKKIVNKEYVVGKKQDAVYGDRLVYVCNDCDKIVNTAEEIQEHIAQGCSGFTHQDTRKVEIQPAIQQEGHWEDVEKEKQVIDYYECECGERIAAE